MVTGYQTSLRHSLPSGHFVGTRSSPAFLVTVDTECDNSWARLKTVTTENARFLRRFQATCECYGLKPTYFTNYEMALSPQFQEFGRDVLRRETAEIGMHLHAWNSPPIVPLTEDDMRYHPYLTEYPESVMRDKVAYMTDLLQDTFDVPVTSHRAGRWGFNAAYARLLLERGYVADCSVTPLNSWASDLGDPHKCGGPDYSNFPLLPYYLDLRDICRPGVSPLLEIPVTAMELHSPMLQAVQRPLGRRSLARRVVNRCFPARCLLAPGRRNIRLLLQVVKKSLDAARPCVQFALHSSNLMPGGSPLFPTNRHVDDFYDDLHELFSCVKGKFLGRTVTEFRTEFAEAYTRIAA